MDERDLQAEQAAARLGVDQLGAGRRRARRARRRCRRPRRRRGACPARAARGSDRRACRPPSARAARSGCSPTRSEAASTPCSATTVAVLELGAEEPPVGLDRLVEVGDGDAEVVDAERVHRGDAISCRYRAVEDARRRARTRPPPRGVMNRSRSMSSITCSTSWPEWRAMICGHPLGRLGDLARGDLDVGRRAAEAGGALVDHQLRVREHEALPRRRRPRGSSPRPTCPCRCRSSTRRASRAASRRRSPCPRTPSRPAS